MSSLFGHVEGYTEKGLAERKITRSRIRALIAAREEEIKQLPWWAWIRRRALEGERWALYLASNECLSPEESWDEMKEAWEGAIEREISIRSPLMSIVGPDDTFPIISKENT